VPSKFEIPIEFQVSLGSFQPWRRASLKEGSWLPEFLATELVTRSWQDVFCLLAKPFDSFQQQFTAHSFLAV
jgi:hypothetical protein